MCFLKLTANWTADGLRRTNLISYNKHRPQPVYQFRLNCPGMMKWNQSLNCVSHAKITQYWQNKEFFLGLCSPPPAAVISVSSSKSWSTQGLKSVLEVPLGFAGALEVVSASLDLRNKKPITRHRTRARTGVSTDSRAMTEDPARFSWVLMLWHSTSLIWSGSVCVTTRTTLEPHIHKIRPAYRVSHLCYKVLLWS